MPYTPISDIAIPTGYTPIHEPGSYASSILDSDRGRFEFKPSPAPVDEHLEFRPNLLQSTNNSFTPVVRDGEEDLSVTRLKGLASYVTADMRADSESETKRIFGNVLKYTADHTTNMYVGRAIASAFNMAESPELLFMRPEFASQGYKIPNEWQDRNQLYASIGSQFAIKEREKMQKVITHEQAVLRERSKDPNAITKAVLNAVSRDTISPADRIMLDACGITPASIRKVNAALNLFGQNFDSATTYKNGRERFAESEASLEASESDIASHIVTGSPEHDWWGEGEVNKFAAYNVADLFADDKVARGLFLQIVAMAGKNKRNEEEGNTIGSAAKIIFNKAGARLGSALAEMFMFMPDVAKGQNADIVNDRRNALLHDIRQAYDQGYNERDNELGFSWSRIPIMAAEVTAGTVGYLHPVGWVAEATDMWQKGIEESASNIYKEDAENMQASWWERKGAAGLKTATFGAAIAATGGIAKGAGILGSRLMPNVAKRVMGSKWLSFGARVAEGTTTEALEELANAAGQEMWEGIGVIADRQKKQNMTEMWNTWTSPEFWAGNVGMNLVFGMAGYKGSRSKAPYQLAQELRDIGFSKKEASAVVSEVEDAIAAGESPAKVQQILTRNTQSLLVKNPAKAKKGLLQSAIASVRRRDFENAAADGVRDALLKESNISNMQKQDDGTYICNIVKHGKDGRFESIEQTLTEDQLNEWLASEAGSRIANEILGVQELVRGERLVMAAENMQKVEKSPFERIAFLQDAPSEVLAKLKGKSTFDEETISIFTRYAADEINRRMAGGETRQQAEAAEFGSTGASLGAVSNLSTSYAERERIERQKGGIAEGALTESAAFILPGKTVGDNILMLARGEVSPRDIAHDWLEGFARARYYSDPELWADRLDALDRELLMRGIIRNSLFSKPEGKREALHYIEALSHLAEQRWLVDSDQYNMTDSSTALLADMLEELGAVQNGLAAARELAAFMASEDGQKVLNDKGALNRLMTEAHASLSDLLAEADKQSPQTAADFVLQHRERMRRELEELASEIEAPPPTATHTLQDPAQEIELGDGSKVTAGQIAAVNDINPNTGELLAAPATAYRSVKAPKGAGMGLAGGIAHRMPDGSVEGSSELSTLKLHPSMESVDLSRAHGDTSSPVIVYRSKDGTMEIIGGIARYHHDKHFGLSHTHVKVFDAGKKRTHHWAADKARAERIRSGVASVADTLRHMAAHNYNRLKAYKANLIPKGADGRELPTSRAAWLLMKHATKKTISELTAGHITTREALATIADTVDTLDLEQQVQATASFSLRHNLKARIEAATANKLKSKETVELCSLPRVLSALGETGVGIYTRAETLHKLARKHNLSNEEILQTIEALDDPLLVIRESADSYIFFLPIEARNKAGQMAPVMAALRMQRETESGHYLMSAYPLEKTQKIEEEIRRGHLVYSKYNKAALSNSNAPSPFKPDLMRLLVNRGFTDNILTGEEVVNYNFTTHGALDSIIELGDLEFKADVSEPTATFSLREKRKRQYSKLDKAYQNDLFVALYNEAQRMERETINFHSRDANIDDILRNSAKVRGLLSAMFKLVPRDAQPWKTLHDLPERVNTLSRAALNPHEQLSMQDSPGLHPEEIARYNDLTPEQRRQDIAFKLGSAYRSLLKASARSIEAYLCRQQMGMVDAAMKALEPKYQKSGKERRGVTSAAVYEAAHKIYSMMDWGDTRIREALNTQLAILNNPDANAVTQEEKDKARAALITIQTFGGLRTANLQDTMTGVKQFIDFLNTGRAAWEDKIRAERREIEAKQTAIARLIPSIKKSATKEKDRNKSVMGSLMDASMNLAQMLEVASGLKGEVGTMFASWRDGINTAQDNCHRAIQQEFDNLTSCLDNILKKNHGKSGDIARSEFLSDCSQTRDTGAVNQGVIKITRYEFKPEDIEAFEAIRKEQGEEAFKEAVHSRFVSSNTREDMSLDTMPYEEAFNDAKSQAQSEMYRGGKIHVEHYGKRDTQHVESIRLTRLQAANLVMMTDQPSYDNHYDADGRLVKRGTMDINGYTPDVIATLRAYAGADLIELCEYMRETFNHTGLFEAYAEYMGLPFPKEPNYWPGMFDQPTSGSMTDALDSARQGNGLFQMLIVRRDHISPPDIGVSAFTAWQHAITQHYTYVHISPFTREMRRLLRHTDTYDRLCSAMSKNIVDNIIAMLDTLDGAPALELRAARAANKLVGWYQGKHALNLLSANASSMVKQGTAILNALGSDSISLANLPLYLLKARLGLGHKKPEDIMRLPVFQNRLNRDSLTQRAFNLEPDQKIGKWGLGNINVMGMRYAMERPDAWINAYSMAAVYNAKFDELSRAVKSLPGHSGKLSDEDIADIEEACEKEVSNTMHAMAQPMEKADKGAFAQQNSSYFAQFAYMAGETFIKLGYFTAKVRKQQAERAHLPALSRKAAFFKDALAAYGAMLPFSIGTQALLTILGMATGQMPDDDEEKVNWFSAQAVAGLTGISFLNMVPIVNEAIPALASVAGWDKSGFAFATYSNTGIGFSTKNMREVFKVFDDKANSTERWYSFMSLARTLGGIVGLAAARGIKGASTAFDIITGMSTIFNAGPRLALQRQKNIERQEKRKKSQKRQ